MAEALSMGHRKLIAAVAEATYGALTEPASAGTDCFYPLDCEFTLDRPDADNEEANNTRSILENTELKRLGTFSIEMYLKSGGAAGVAPDYTLLLQNYFNTVVAATGGNSATDHSAGASVVGSLKITTAHKERFTVNTPCAVAPSGSTKLQMAVVDALVDGGAAPDSLTISPTLTAVPADASTVYYGSSYSLQANPQNSLSIWYWYDGNHCVMNMGCVINDIDIVTDPKGLQRIIFKGFFADQRQTGTTTLAEELDNSETAIDLTDATIMSNGSLFTVDTETFRVTVDPTSNTVTVAARGTVIGAAATHSTAAEVTPWRPTPSVNAGTIILSGARGYVKISDVDVSCDIISCTIKTTNNNKMDHDGFGCETNQGYAAGKNLTTFDMVVSLKAARFIQLMNFHDKTAKEIFIQWGTSANNMVGVMLANCRYQVASIPSVGLNENHLINISGKARGTTGLDEIRMLYI